VVGTRDTAGALCLVLLAAGCAAPGATSAEATAELRTGSAAFVPAGEGTAIRCGKLLTLDDADRVFDPGMVVIEDGRLAYVGAPIELPKGYEHLDAGTLWAWPGLVDLHSHIHAGGWGDLNDMVLPTNHDISVRPSVDPWAREITLANAGGVTTLFGIPGSGTSIGGFGVLYKTKTGGGYEDMVLRDPGGMKSAFNYNPQRAGGDLGRTWAGLSWNTEHLNDRVAARARREGPEQPDDWATENLQRVHRGELPVLIHCASAEGVAGVVRMWKQRYGTECVVSHGSWDGTRAAAFAAETGTPVNHGPRVMNFLSMVREDRIQGGAAAFVEAGVPLFSLNTDAPVIPQEELFLQGSMSARLGADAYTMVRALTTHPAQSFLVGDRVGSLQVGMDADIVLSSGDPLDPRSRVEVVLIDGEVQYSRRDGQLF
jgi:imidazolonepropionase-like amidohydrolase